MLGEGLVLGVLANHAQGVPDLDNIFLERRGGTNNAEVAKTPKQHLYHPHHILNPNGHTETTLPNRIRAGLLKSKTTNLMCIEIIGFCLGVFIGVRGNVLYPGGPHNSTVAATGQVG